ncbi:flagellar motor protein MotB [Pararhodobacter sp. SW119]|uniref:flagellar motor protein MotB n=1 Tax=Pararhodobacter sp. SW119 TaxID=2780075 RepID=UPI001AE0B93B|nr:flagellar motor protein MotB [Pararhodobacter sp. SW119]
MNRQNNAAPVIIKRKKVVAGGGHHGGAWKVAYADFVTAMMAFFLMLWLLGTTTEDQRKGLADYFTPSTAVSSTSGGGDSMFGNDDLRQRRVTPRPSDEAPAEDGSHQVHPGEAESFDRILERLSGLGAESTIMSDALRHVITRISDEGLVIELFDLPGAPLFLDDGDTPMPVTELLVDILTDAFDLAVNPLALEGHTRTYTVVQANDPRWGLSTSRAERLRLMFEGAGFEPQRIARVAGHADRRPMHQNPMSVRNNRMEMILLRTP